jgi:hypothetical protein
MHCFKLQRCIRLPGPIRGPARSEAVRIRHTVRKLCFGPLRVTKPVPSMAVILPAAKSPAIRTMARDLIVRKAMLIAMPLKRIRETMGLMGVKRKNSTSNLKMARMIPPSTRPRSQARDSPLLSAVMMQTFQILLMSQVTRIVLKKLTRRRNYFVSESVDSGDLDLNGSMFRHGTKIMCPKMIMKEKLPEFWPNHCRMPNMK